MYFPFAYYTIAMRLTDHHAGGCRYHPLHFLVNGWICCSKQLLEKDFSVLEAFGKTVEDL